MKHASVPVFVPHLACKNLCVFCNQKKIAGTERPPENPREFLENAVNALSDRFSEADIAFFGGSFTGLSEKEMDFYLRPAADIRAKNSKITGIRLSTRPDYISQRTLDFLKGYGVTTIELGAQSMNDSVLSKSKRGHLAQDTINASSLIRQNGFELVLQIMPGLPGDTDETIYSTIRAVADIHPDAVRLYPCVVIKDTEMEEMYYRGDFTPLSVEKAVKICADAVRVFTPLNIKVIRTGLHSSDLVKNQSVVAGPFHPAFGEMVSQRIYLENAENLLMSKGAMPDRITLCVGKGCTSKMNGQKRKNIIYLENKFGTSLTVTECADIAEYDIKEVSE